MLLSETGHKLDKLDSKWLIKGSPETGINPTNPSLSCLIGIDWLVSDKNEKGH